MNDFQTQLRAILRGRVCLVGLGNVARGDDGVGVCLVQAFAEAIPNLPVETRSRASALVGGVHAETQLSHLPVDLDHVLFIDAADFGGEAGSVILLDSAQMQARYPQVSTHRLSLGLLAQLVESARHARAWLLGVQPESLREAATLSVNVAATVRLLVQLLTECAAAPIPEEQIA